MIRRVGLVALTGGYTAVHAHRCRVSLVSPTGRSARGRSYRATTTATRDGGTWQEVATFAPPLHERMEILGRPGLPACGMEVLVGPDDQHLTAFTLVGGP